MKAAGTTDLDRGEAVVPRPLTKTLSEQCLTPPNVLGEVEGRLRDLPPYGKKHGYFPATHNRDYGDDLTALLARCEALERETDGATLRAATFERQYRQAGEDHAAMKAHRDELEREGKAKDALLVKAREALETIRDATDADRPDSYRADDREGCLDMVFATASSIASEIQAAKVGK